MIFTAQYDPSGKIISVVVDKWEQETLFDMEFLDHLIDYPSDNVSVKYKEKMGENGYKEPVEIHITVSNGSAKYAIVSEDDYACTYTGKLISCSLKG